MVYIMGKQNFDSMARQTKERSISVLWRKRRYGIQYFERNHRITMKKKLYALYKAVLLILCVTSPVSYAALVSAESVQAAPVQASENEADAGINENNDGEVIDYESGSYKLEEDGWTLLRYNESEKTVTLPDKIRDIPVTEISSLAFSNNAQIEVVNIPANIKRIEGTRIAQDRYNCDFEEQAELDNIVYDGLQPGAFALCTSLKSVNIDEKSLLSYIGPMAFSGCGALECINLPERMEEIGIAAFINCKSLISITVPNGIEVINEKVFRSCYSLEKVVLPISVKSINHQAFDGCVKLSDINIPEDLEIVEGWAFACCYLKEIRFGSKLSAIDYLAFSNIHSLESIYVDDDNPYYSTLDGVLFSKDKSILYICPLGKSGTYYVPSSVKTIYNGAFSQSSLSEVVVSEGVEEIRQLAFSGTWNLKLISLPSTLNILDDRALLDINGLEKINISEDNQYYLSVDGVLYTKDMKRILLYPAKRYNKEYDMPEGVETAGEYVFRENRYLKKIILPSTFQNMHLFTFYIGEGELESIEVSADNNYYSSVDGVLYSKSMDKLICYPDGKRDEVYIVPDSVRIIDNYSIYEQRYLKKLYVREGIEHIGDCVLFRCNNLEYVSLPGSLNTIYSYFASYTANLKAISIPGNVDFFAKYSFMEGNGDIYCDSSGITAASSYYTINDYAAHEKAGHHYDEEVVHSYMEDCTLYTCSICGHMEKTTICSHEWDEEYTIDKENTCIESGRKSIHCEKCDAVKEVVIDATGHDYGDWETVKQPKCGEDGVMQHVCRNCGHVVKKPIEGIKHDYGEWEIVEPQTCEKSGSRRRICNNCRHIDVGKIEASGHNWNTFYTIDRKPKCIEEGSESIHCANCKAVKLRRAIPVQGHVITIDEAVYPTCISTGLTEGKHCSVCDEIISKQEILPVTAHLFDEWETVQLPSCEENGLKKRICGVCGDVETKVIAATGHEWNTFYTIDKKASYTEYGSESIHCKNCAAVKDCRDTDMLTLNNQEKDDAKEQMISVSKKASGIITYKASALKKRKITFNIGARAEGRITYKVIKGRQYIKVSDKGKVTIMKKTKKGTYRILITAGKTAVSKQAKQYVVIKIR